MTRARGSKPVGTHAFYLIVNNAGNSTRFDFLDDATDEVTKVKNAQLVCFILNQFRSNFVTWKTARSVNVNLRTTQVHLVIKRRFFLILKRAYESLFVSIHKTKKVSRNYEFGTVKRKRQLPCSTRAFNSLECIFQK